MKKSYLIIFILLPVFLSGCLTFHRISYKLTLKDGLKGEGTIAIYDIRSDAETTEELEKDKKTLFNYILKSDDFISDMLDEGKNIISRRLFKEDDVLNGEAELTFDDIRKVEGISYEDGFYFMTMALEDSIYYTNGEVIFSGDFKRIIWGEDTETIIFEMIAVDYDDMYYRDLSPYYKE